MIAESQRNNIVDGGVIKKNQAQPGLNIIKQRQIGRHCLANTPGGSWRQRRTAEEQAVPRFASAQTAFHILVPTPQTVHPASCDNKFGTKPVLIETYCSTTAVIACF